MFKAYLNNLYTIIQSDNRIIGLLLIGLLSSNMFFQYLFEIKMNVYGITFRAYLFIMALLFLSKKIDLDSMRNSQILNYIFNVKSKK